MEVVMREGIGIIYTVFGVVEEVVFWKKVGRKGRLNSREGSGSLALAGVPFRRERVNLKARLRMKFSRSTSISFQVSVISNA